MIVYKDMTFCINTHCTKKCSKFLTPEIELAAKHYGLPIACSEYICLYAGEDGVYKYNGDKANEAMSSM